MRLMVLVCLATIVALFTFNGTMNYVEMFQPAYLVNASAGMRLSTLAPVIPRATCGNGV